jgi:ubiquinone/menaquinone biosynthesis C-methylase UbiE
VSDSYHLEELRIAADRDHPAHLLPPPIAECDRVLDVGCGAGQTLLAAYPGRPTFGLDCDFSALRSGRAATKHVQFACGRAEALPYADQRFDLVVARVSLAYTNIPASLQEIHRVLREGGAVWMTLHPFLLCWQQAKRANLKGRIYFVYIILNSLTLYLLQKQFTLFGRQETFQTEKGMVRALTAAGFREIRILRGEQFLVTARA